MDIEKTTENAVKQSQLIHQVKSETHQMKE